MRTVTYFSSAFRYSTSASAQPQHAAAVADDEFGRVRSRAGGRPAAAQRDLLGDALQRRLQPLAAHRLGQVVRRGQLERLQRMLGMRGDEDQRRRAVGAALLRSSSANDSPSRPGSAMSSSSRSHRCWLSQTRAWIAFAASPTTSQRGCDAVFDQAAQPPARRLLVVDDQDAQRRVVWSEIGQGVRHRFVRACGSRPCGACRRQRNRQVDAVPAGVRRDLEARRQIVHQPQAVAHILQCDAVARAARAGVRRRRQRIADRQPRLAVAHAGADAHHAAVRIGLDAVAHRILDQRLQQQRRHARGAGGGIELPHHLQPAAEADLLDRQVAPRQLDLVVAGVTALGIDRERDPEQLGQVLEQRLGALRVASHQTERTVQGVEQEVRPDARLQFGQPRGRIGRQRGRGRAAAATA